jgi:hypothetical protein
VSEAAGGTTVGPPVDGFVAPVVPPQAASRTEAPSERAIRVRFMLAMCFLLAKSKYCVYKRIHFDPTHAT